MNPTSATPKHDTPFDRRLLVLGGARSGKSRHAQAVAEALAEAGPEAGVGTLTYIATAQAFDAEMVDRIDRHRADRDQRWHTVEAPIDLPAAIIQADASDAVILVDCLTLWTSNLLLGEQDAEHMLRQLLDAIAAIRGRLILVANETGLGIVPDNALARRFRDLAGRINQQVAASVDAVDFVLAGLPRRWK
ncbi:bifunctional adenosylcobinamide kinase/adenosylcobinamide-phosphate guanylyltransferase [Sphingomonas sp. PB4P5]|uniref:bifunctional adenosylcobinamide kinase/adenosylcobinamide-phosphate guanylyltransferase n=1 Tax=Parasphingomonas puruogangriensis TaxID=3096155 RepID=UPI002FC6BCDF